MIDDPGSELAMLRADFNDCNRERARWRAENERLREALATIANHSDTHSDFPHNIDNLQLYAKQVLAGSR